MRLSTLRKRCSRPRREQRFSETAILARVVGGSASNVRPSINFASNVTDKGVSTDFATHNIIILVISSLSINRIAKNAWPANVLET